MKYNEVKGVRFTLTSDKPEDEIILDEQYEYVKIEDIQGGNNIAVYINNYLGVDYTVQAILMR